MTLAMVAAIALGWTARADAQDQPPDLRILLNLDLFGRTQEAGASSGSQPAPGPSMLEQIRTLRAMGYLGGAKKTESAAVSAGPQPEGNTPSAPDQSNDEGTPQL
jgi:hypothetical protein